MGYISLYFVGEFDVIVVKFLDLRNGGTAALDLKFEHGVGKYRTPSSMGNELRCGTRLEQTRQAESSLISCIVSIWGSAKI